MAARATVEPLPLVAPGAPASGVDPWASRAGRGVPVASGTWVYRQGECPGGLFLVVRGLIREWAVSDDGREAILDLLGPGDVFGAAEGPAPTGAQAVAAAEILAVGLGEKATGALPLTLLADAQARRVSRLIRLAQDLMWLDVPARVERRLRDLAARHGRPTLEGTVVDVALTQQDLASLAGTTRESVNRAVRSLVRSGRLQVVGHRYVVGEP